MLQSFPRRGTRVVLLKDTGAIRSGSIGTVIRSMGRTDKETPEDVFVVDHRGEAVWVLRRDVEAVD